MQTRSSCFASQQQPAAPLPLELQQRILDAVISAYSEPNSTGQEYELYPFKTTLSWLLSLKRVCKAWRTQLQGSAMLCRRIRLERLMKVVMAHDYVHFIQSATPKAVRARKCLPASVQLPFLPHLPPVVLTVCKKLSKTESSGLPSKALMLAADGGVLVEQRLLQQMLEDMAVLDGHHNAAFVLKVCTSQPPQHGSAHAALQHDPTEQQQAGGQQLHQQEQPEPQHQQPQQQQLQQQEQCNTAEGMEQSDHIYYSTVEPLTAHDSQRTIFKSMVAAFDMMPLHLRHALAMEASEDSMTLYFIPTVVGFHRRIPLP